jgi:NADH:ubiquinone oxidoreductase subunit C
MTVVASISEDNIADAIKKDLGTAVESVTIIRKNRMLVVASAGTVRQVATWLQTFGFDHTLAVSGVDYPPEDRLDVVYLLSSYSRDDLKGMVMLLTIHLKRDSPTLPSLTPVWESANLFERETYEMFGITFEGHPNLKKLLLQDNWDGPPPLRKDLKIPEMA